MIRTVSPEELVEEIHRAVADSAQTVELFVKAGREYDRTGCWPRPFNTEARFWEDLWMFSGRDCAHLLENSDGTE